MLQLFSCLEFNNKPNFEATVATARKVCIAGSQISLILNFSIGGRVKVHAELDVNQENVSPVQLWGKNSTEQEGVLPGAVPHTGSWLLSLSRAHLEDTPPGGARGTRELSPRAPTLPVLPVSRHIFPNPIVTWGGTATRHGGKASVSFNHSLVVALTPLQKVWSCCVNMS